MLIYWLMFSIFSASALQAGSAIAQSSGPMSGQYATAVWRRSIALSIATVALLLLIGLRYRVGGDWPNYINVFRRIAPQELGPVLTNSTIEPGYAVANWLAAELGKGVWLVNLICALPFTYGLYRICRQQPNPWLALVVATPFLIVVVGMGYTRQAAALGCLMIGLSGIVEKRPSAYFVLWALVGSAFHRTVLAFIPIMLIAAVKNRVLAYTLVVASAAVSYFVLLPGAMSQYGAGYLQQRYDAAGAVIRVVMGVIPAVVVLLNGRRFYWSREERSVWSTYAVLCVLAGLSLPFIHSSVVVDRLAIYLIPLQVFAYGRIGYAFGLARRGWLSWTVGIIVYSAAVLFVWLNYAVNAYAWVPYHNYLSEPPKNPADL